MPELSARKQLIIEKLASYKQFDLKKICDNLGFKTPEQTTCFSSKKAYVESLVISLTDSQLDLIERKMRSQLNIKFPQDFGYNYILSDVTKRDIINCIERRDSLESYIPFLPVSKFNWYGLMDEWKFICRFCNPDIIKPNYKYRSFKEEYTRHRVQNDDFDNCWFFMDERFPFVSGTDEQRLNIMVGMFDPEVRDETSNWKNVFDEINKLIMADGFELFTSSFVSGRDKYGWRKIGINNLAVIPNVIKQSLASIDSQYIADKIKFIEDEIDTRPDAAIGDSKELLETIMKEILKLQNGSVQSEDFTGLYNDVREVLNLNPKKNPVAKEDESIKLILGGLGNIVHGIAEMRNRFGTGHGHDSEYKQLPSRYAKLVAGATSSLSAFLWDTWEWKRK